MSWLLPWEYAINPKTCPTLRYFADSNKIWFCHSQLILRELSWSCIIFGSGLAFPLSTWTHHDFCAFYQCHRAHHRIFVSNVEIDGAWHSLALQDIANNKSRFMSFLDTVWVPVDIYHVNHGISFNALTWIKFNCLLHFVLDWHLVWLLFRFLKSLSTLSASFFLQNLTMLITQTNWDSFKRMRILCRAWS